MSEVTVTVTPAPVTARPKIRISATDFMALHLSALEHGGIGRNHSWVGTDPSVPNCKQGHAYSLDPTGKMNQRLTNAGLHIDRNDDTLKDAGVLEFDRVDFETYIQLLNIDIKE